MIPVCRSQKAPSIPNNNHTNIVYISYACNLHFFQSKYGTSDKAWCSSKSICYSTFRRYHFLSPGSIFRMSDNLPAGGQRSYINYKRKMNTYIINELIEWNSLKKLIILSFIFFYSDFISLSVSLQTSKYSHPGYGQAIISLATLSTSLIKNWRYFLCY